MKFPMANFISNPYMSQKTPPAREQFFIACLLKRVSISCQQELQSQEGIGYFYDAGCLGRRPRTQASAKVLGLGSSQNEQCKTHMSPYRQISELGMLRPKTVYQEGRIM